MAPFPPKGTAPSTSTFYRYRVISLVGLARSGPEGQNSKPIHPEDFHFFPVPTIGAISGDWRLRTAQNGLANQFLHHFSSTKNNKIRGSGVVDP